MIKYYAVLGFLFVVLTTNIHAQKGIEDGSQYGHGEDSVRCRQNRSLYLEYYNHKDYEFAYKFWKSVFNECPKSSKNVFLHGEKILKDKIEDEKDPVLRSNLLDTLMLLFDRRIEFFGEKGKVKGRQGIALLNYRRSEDVKYIEQAYQYLSESVDLEKGKTTDATLATFFTASVSLYQNNIFSAGKVLEDYTRANYVLEHKTRGKIEELQQNIDNILITDGPDNCDTIVSCFSAIYDTKKSDKDFLITLTTLLKKQDCTNDPLFYKASVALYDLEPSAKAAENIALLAVNRNELENTVKYYKEAAELEQEPVDKAKYLYGVALGYKKMGQKENAKQYALKAIQSNSNYGDPYILIAQLYIEYKSECNNLKLPRSVYWVAVDKLNKAKAVDASVTDKANKLILAYSVQYPTKEKAFFEGIHEGDPITVDCWINETTKARFNE